MNILATVLLPLTQETPAPEDVKAGWVAFAVFLLLVAAVVFLWFSMRKHLGRVNFDENNGSETNGSKPSA